MRSSRMSRNLEEARRAIEDPALFAQTMLNQDIWSKQQKYCSPLQNVYARR
jgi:hypothetical protein